MSFSAFVVNYDLFPYTVRGGSSPNLRGGATCKEGAKYTTERRSLKLLFVEFSKCLRFTCKFTLYFVSAFSLWMRQTVICLFYCVVSPRITWVMRRWINGVIEMPLKRSTSPSDKQPVWSENVEKIVKKLFTAFFIYLSIKELLLKKSNMFIFRDFPPLKFLFIFLSLTLDRQFCHMATKYLKRILLPWICQTPKSDLYQNIGHLLSCG